MNPGMEEIVRLAKKSNVYAQNIKSGKNKTHKKEVVNRILGRHLAARTIQKAFRKSRIVNIPLKKGCGEHAIKMPGYGAQSMKTPDMKKFIEKHGSDYAKRALRSIKGVPTRAQLCGIFHMFKEGRDEIRKGAGYERLPSPIRSANRNFSALNSPTRRNVAARRRPIRHGESGSPKNNWRLTKRSTKYTSPNNKGVSYPFVGKNPNANKELAVFAFQEGQKKQRLRSAFKALRNRVTTTYRKNGLLFRRPRKVSKKLLKKEAEKGKHTRFVYNSNNNYLRGNVSASPGSSPNNFGGYGTSGSNNNGGGKQKINKNLLGREE